MSIVDPARRRCVRCNGALYTNEDGDSGCLLCGAREYRRAAAPLDETEDSEPRRSHRAFEGLPRSLEAFELIARHRRAA